MAFTFTATEGGAQLETGVYDAILTEIVPVQSTKPDDGERTYARWVFKVSLNGSDPVMITANSSLSFGPKSKARQWYQAVLGKPITTGQVVEPAKDLPLPCQIVVKLAAKPGSDAAYSNITDVWKASTKAAMPAASEPDDIPV